MRVVLLAKWVRIFCPDFLSQRKVSLQLPWQGPICFALRFLTQWAVWTLNLLFRGDVSRKSDLKGGNKVLKKGKSLFLFSLHDYALLIRYLHTCHKQHQQQEITKPWPWQLWWHQLAFYRRQDRLRTNLAWHHRWLQLEEFVESTCEKTDDRVIRLLKVCVSNSNVMNPYSASDRLVLGALPAAGAVPLASCCFLSTFAHVSGSVGMGGIPVPDPLTLQKQRSKRNERMSFLSFACTWCNVLFDMLEIVTSHKLTQP